MIVFDDFILDDNGNDIKSPCFQCMFGNGDCVECLFYYNKKSIFEL